MGRDWLEIRGMDGGGWKEADDRRETKSAKTAAKPSVTEIDVFVLVNTIIITGFETRLPK